MIEEPDVTDPSKYINILIIATSIYVIIMLIIIYFALFVPIKSTPDKLSDEYIKQQQQTSIENYFKEKNVDPRNENRFYNYFKNYSVKFRNYFKETISWFYDNRNFFIVLFSGFGLSALTLSWINYYDSKKLGLIKYDTTNDKIKALNKELKKKQDAKNTLLKDFKPSGKSKEDLIEHIRNKDIKDKEIQKYINVYNNEINDFNDKEVNYKPTSEIINIGLYDKIKIPFLWVTGLTILILLLFLLTFTTFKLDHVQIIVNILILIGLVSVLYERFEEFQTEIGITLIFFIIFTLLGGWILGTIFALIGYCIGFYLNLYIQENKSGTDRPYRYIFKFINLIIGFLPCLFINFATWIKEEYLKTSKNILILIGIEALLIVFKFLIPFIYSLFKKIFSPKENILLINPVPLNRVTNLGLFLTTEEVKLSNTSKLDTSDKFFNYNYAVAFSLWIFPQPKSVSDAYSKSCNLINISDIIKVIHNNNIIEFWASTTISGENPNRLIKLYELKDFKYQKWNSIIINYQGGSLDIFVNKTLKSSTPNITPLKNNNNAVVGDINGINGGIKNVSYFQNALSQQDINLKI